MREIFYKYDNRGSYQTNDNTYFSDDSHIRIIVEPHQFSIAINNEELRNTSFGGCSAVISCEGEVIFYDNQNNVIAKADKSERNYRQIKFDWKQGFISIEFGYTDVVDYYPNCDGEYDRWGREWVAERSVTLNIKNNSVEIK